MADSKTYAVTGVASGIGAELTKLLQARGHKIIGFDIAQPDYDIYQFIEIDLADETSIDTAASVVSVPLDGLCNNAGLPPREGLEQKILQVNFFGQRRFTNAILPKLNSDASIVMMASRAGQAWRENIEQVKRLSMIDPKSDIEAFVSSEGIDSARAYNLSKEAVIAWSVNQAEQLIQRGVRINTISPSAVATGILDDFAKAFGDRMVKNVQRAGRAGTPEEIARIAAFMLSQESSWIKGADIAVDGGMGAFAISDALGLSILSG